MPRPWDDADTYFVSEGNLFFRELNAKDGVTLLIVTHERRVSSVAKRVIAMRDGQIVETSDEELEAAHIKAGPA